MNLQAYRLWIKNYFHMKIWLMLRFDYHLICFHMEFSFFVHRSRAASWVSTALGAEGCQLHTAVLQSPLNGGKEWQSDLVSPVSYSGLAPSPLLAFVTLMHWLGNISGMLISGILTLMQDYNLLPVKEGFTAGALGEKLGSMISPQNNRGEWMN